MQAIVIAGTARTSDVCNFEGRAFADPKRNAQA
jgi:hypothetical protein